jgi:hypothetical protein
MLKRFQKYCYLLLSFLVIAGCSPDLPIPEPTDGNVVFEMTAKINGETINLAGGKDNRYMFTSFDLDSNGVLIFRGTLGEVGCPNCPNSLSFEFTQAVGNATTDALFSTANSPNLTYRNALIPMEIVGYDVNFDMNLQGVAPFNLVWDFGDSTTLNSNSGTLQHHYTDAGIYEVCVNVTDATGCQSTICRTIATDNSMNCSVNFSVYHVAGLNYFFYPFSAGVPPFDYQWNIPDGSSTQFSAASSPTILMNQIGIMPVTVNMTDGNNCSSSMVQLVDFNNPDAVCLNHFNYQSKPLFTLGIAQNYFSTFAIKYIDNNGITYSSDLGEQPTFSFINILEIEDYLENENNQPTKKITLEMACRLFDSNGNYVDLTDGFGTIAIAHQD